LNIKRLVGGERSLPGKRRRVSKALMQGKPKRAEVLCGDSKVYITRRRHKVKWVEAKQSAEGRAQTRIWASFIRRWRRAAIVSEVLGYIQGQNLAT
jgi:hypothetical protein